MPETLAIIFMSTLGAALILAGVGIAMLSTVQDSRIKLYGCVILGIVCIIAGLGIVFAPVE
ncbi:hypothetical protein WU87_03335 [Corynebacterium minutissimum]|uniref:Uncharacterized protein n=1 Tax=Corynebacterium minutissimum TaxID=38301 RepID=A0ACC4UCH0_9CORY|nr:hypothetical protein WU87_03335 [Corynebacterium minutissimum]